MAPTNPKPEPTKLGEEVLDLVIPYIHNAEDRSSVSLVSRKFYELDGITRKRLTVHVLYYPNPASLSKRFPFIESITIRGPPSAFNQTYHIHHRIKITPWIHQLAHEFRCLKQVHIRCMVVHNEDLETLATTRGKDLRTLKLRRCIGFSMDGLMHVSKYCNQLKTLILDFSYIVGGKYGFWLHQLALNSKVLERLHVKDIDISDNAQELTLLAKNCCNSLISLKIGKCYLSKLGDAFSYAVRLEHFGGTSYDEESELVGFKFPPNISSLSRLFFRGTQFSSILPRLNQIRILKLAFSHMDEDNQCLLFKRCPNLEVLYTIDPCGDRILEVLGKFCKKLRKLTHYGLVTQVGLIALAQGCTKIECLKVTLGDISNEAIECLGTHLKNLCKFRMELVKNAEATDLPLDNGIRVMLKGCRKLEKLDLNFHSHKGLTDLGLEYIGEFGANLRSLSLTLSGNSNAGLVKLSKGCASLRKLNIDYYPSSKQAVASFVFNIHSLRYVWGFCSNCTPLALTRPEFQL